MQMFTVTPVDSILLIASIFVAVAILSNADAVGRILEVIDCPDGGRKAHALPTPLVGGIAIMLPLTLWAGLSVLVDRPFNADLLTVVVLCGGLATLVGLIDDQSPTSPLGRLLFLSLITITALVIDPELVPRVLHWVQFGDIPVASWFAFGFVALAMCGFVNAVNMTDGQNGIALGTFLIWAICLCFVSSQTTAAISEVLVALVGVTFLYNINGRAFLGDSGSYGVSFVFGILAIRAQTHWGLPAETIGVWFFVPVADCLRLMVVRAIRGKPVTGGGTDHLHHLLARRLGKEWGVTCYLGVIGTSSLIATEFPSLGARSLYALAILYVLVCIWLDRPAQVTEVQISSDTLSEGPSTPQNGAPVLQLVEKLHRELG